MSPSDRGNTRGEGKILAAKSAKQSGQVQQKWRRFTYSTRVTVANDLHQVLQQDQDKSTRSHCITTAEAPIPTYPNNFGNKLINNVALEHNVPKKENVPKENDVPAKEETNLKL